MAPGIGAGGFLGVALEATAGTYTPPTKFVPIESESLAWTQDTTFRRPIRQSADVIGAVAGNGHVEGDINMEAFEDVVALMLHAARTNVTKTGTAPDFEYEFTGDDGAIPAKTMSVTVVRNGQVFGYVGCVVGSFTFTIENGLLRFNTTILGTSEASQTAPVPTWAATQTPYGDGSYTIEIPTATQVFDTDNFSFQVEDNAQANNRLKDSLGAQFVSFGERSVTLSVDRDFETRADYDAFKALTAQDITLKATKTATRSIFLNTPAAIKDSYDLGLSGQGDLIRASVSYQGVIDAAGKSYTITVATAEDITP